MRNRLYYKKFVAIAGLVAVIGGALAACTLQKVSVPGFSGPSEFGIALKLTVTPDVIYADGFSTAVVQVEARGPDGKVLSNVDVFFEITDAGGTFANIGALNTNRAATGSNGIAQVQYTAPARTDFTANNFVLIVARPVGSDAGGQTYRQVRLELRSAEPRLFPPNPANCAGGSGSGCPVADFRTELGPDGQVLFQTICTDTEDDNGRVGEIVRYSWDFGDGSEFEDKPDVNHRFAAGVYNVVHACTDDNGAADSITKTIQVD